MAEVTIVEIINPKRYNLHQSYGILVQQMNETSVVNFDSNMGGMCINIKNSDYRIVPPYMWEVFEGKAIIPCCGGYINTGLKIWNLSKGERK